MNKKLIVIGEMNTDIIVSGLPRFPQKGELVNGSSFAVGPGGKSRNIAEMAAQLMPSDSVAMVSKTAKDQHGLWSVPLDALNKAGVDTKYVSIDRSSSEPGIALILVDDHGNNQIIGAPGITRKFSPDDVSQAEPLFMEVGQNKGFMAFIGNCPSDTAQCAVKMARQHGVKVLFDPGGADDVSALSTLLTRDIFVFKPNEHEASELAGVRVTDFGSAEKAAATILDKGVENVLITTGADGAYLFNADTHLHIPVPEIDIPSDEKDETGCGDQTLAALCSGLQRGLSIEESATLAVRAGTIQFHRAGIHPIKKEDFLP